MRAVPETLVDNVGSGTVAGIAVLVLIAVAVATSARSFSISPRFGIHVFAVGSDQEAARRAGINVRNRLIAIYMLSGTLAGLPP